MSTSARRLWGVLVFLGVLAAHSGQAVADDYSIHLDGVPAWLSYPSYEARNVMLRATIQGGEAKRVWLSVDRAAVPGVALTRAGNGAYEVNLCGVDVNDLVRHLPREGELHVYADMPDGTVVSSAGIRYTFRGPPKRFDFPGDKVAVTAYQRTSTVVPGSDDAVLLHLGDITAGQVGVSIRDGSYRVLVGKRSLREDDTIALKLEDEQYVIRLDKLVNILIGPDHAEFTVWVASAFTGHEIQRLLALVETADVIFVRNGKEASPAEAARHLRRKYEAAREHIDSVERFIDLVATRSSTTGKPYLVKLPDGTTVELADWLRKRLKEPDQPAPAESPGEDGD